MIAELTLFSFLKSVVTCSEPARSAAVMRALAR
jgi:hypothetical protein